MLGPRNRDIDLAGAWGEVVDDEFVELGQAKFKQLTDTKEHQ